MNNKKKIIITLGIVIWIAGLFLLNPIILKINHRTATKVILDDYMKSDSTVLYAVDSTQNINNIFGDVEIKGWAFIEHDDENPDKQIKLIFSSEEQTYAFDATLTDRKDLFTAASLKDYKVPPYHNGFNLTFSPLGMKNGEYRLYIYVMENEELTGLVETRKVFINHYGDFSE